MSSWLTRSVHVWSKWSNKSIRRYSPFIELNHDGIVPRNVLNSCQYLKKSSLGEKKRYRRPWQDGHHIYTRCSTLVFFLWHGHTLYWRFRWDLWWTVQSIFHAVIITDLSCQTRLKTCAQMTNHEPCANHIPGELMDDVLVNDVSSILHEPDGHP